jgi:glycerophosphoryl diester phosphodiesterase
VIFTPKPAVVGHRGFGRGSQNGLTENTVESCVAAAEAGVPWIEIDVQRTADDQLVLRHDVTAPDGSYIVGRTAAELARQGIARLDDVLGAVPPDVGIDLDVKTVLTDAVAPRARRTGTLLATALTRQSRRRFLVTSFDPGLLISLRPALPHVSFGLLTYLHFPLQHAIPAAAELGLGVIGLHTGSFGPQDEAPFAPGEQRPPFPAAVDAIGTAHRAGLEVLVWCPDNAAARRYAAAGADALCVDDVPATLAALADGLAALADGGVGDDPAAHRVDRGER